ncbi:MAG: uroporphyrinogen-III C-methyltransferase [candidate division NC10 bacterium]|nr:uroporphyrinogen-III C-methyltransferase [candidate division NC10 bacterium]
MAESVGKVYLIGAGPGDPGLFTQKGVRCLGKAHLVICDHLADPRLLRYARADAEVIYAGKRAGQGTSQEEINRLIVVRARAGQVVARLKGGDPFIFGRGGEEAEELSKAGIPFEVVPGITAAIAVPAYAGIPLTHRDFASSVAFVTGHEDPTKPQSGIAWEQLARGIGTLVFLMGVGRLREIAEQLVAHGRPAATPAALIRWGTRAEQRTVVAPLGEIAARAAEENIRPPALLVVGEVVRLQAALAWFERKPLFGRRIIVARSREEPSLLAEMLEDEGAEVLELPSIRTLPPGDWGPLDSSVARLHEYQWLCFTSATSVTCFWGRLEAAGRDARGLAHLRIAAFGLATREALRTRGVHPDLSIAGYRAELVAGALESIDLRQAAVLFPGAVGAREKVPDLFRQRAARVDVVPAFRTALVGWEDEGLATLLRDGQIDAVAFTSSSTVDSFLEALGSDRRVTLFHGVAVACLGPMVTERARRAGLPVNVEPDESSLGALQEALIRYFAREDRRWPS